MGKEAIGITATLSDLPEEGGAGCIIKVISRPGACHLVLVKVD